MAERGELKRPPLSLLCALSLSSMAAVVLNLLRDLVVVLVDACRQAEGLEHVVRVRHGEARAGTGRQDDFGQFLAVVVASLVRDRLTAGVEGVLLATIEVLEVLVDRDLLDGAVRAHVDLTHRLAFVVGLGEAPQHHGAVAIAVDRAALALAPAGLQVRFAGFVVVVDTDRAVRPHLHPELVRAVGAVELEMGVADAPGGFDARLAVGVHLAQAVVAVAAVFFADDDFAVGREMLTVEAGLGLVEALAHESSAIGAIEGFALEGLAGEVVGLRAGGQTSSAEEVGLELVASIHQVTSRDQLAIRAVLAFANRLEAGDITLDGGEELAVLADVDCTILGERFAVFAVADRIVGGLAVNQRQPFVNHHLGLAVDHVDVVDGAAKVVEHTTALAFVAFAGK